MTYKTGRNNLSQLKWGGTITNFFKVKLRFFLTEETPPPTPPSLKISDSKLPSVLRNNHLKISHYAHFMQINANLIEMTKKIRRKFRIHPTIKKTIVVFLKQRCKNYINPFVANLPWRRYKKWGECRWGGRNSRVKGPTCSAEGAIEVNKAQFWGKKGAREHGPNLLFL